MKFCYKNIAGLLLLLLSATVLYAQEANENADQAAIYLNGRTDALDSYLGKTKKLQQKLLEKLQREEAKILRKLAKQDSVLYKQYIQQQRLNFDTIALRSNDTSSHPSESAGKIVIDSLRGVQRFIQDQSGKINNVLGVGGKVGLSVPGADKLNALEQKLSAQISTDQLIRQHTAELEKMAGSMHISGLENLQKKVYYAREKMKAYRKLADDPDEAEAEALEYLQGTEGFESYLHQNNNDAFGGMGNSATAEDLQRMGYQTKAQVTEILQQKLGQSLNTVQQQMGEQIQQYSEKLNELKKQADAIKTTATEAKQTLVAAKTAKDNLKNIKPTFHKNEEKGKPFRQRLEWQYNFQTTRSSSDGLKPAMLNLGMAVGYKQSKNFSMGIGFGLNTGLGRNWQHLKLSYEGISLRAYADRMLIYGFSLQAGYERSFIPSNRAYLANNIDPGNNNNPAIQPSNNPLQQAFGGQQQTAYIGIMKRYRIGSKWSGTFLAGYNFLWKQDELRSPWLLRFGWGK